MVRASEIIPPMVDPLSSGWDQPDLKWILIGDDAAWMDTKTFKELKEYSSSQPSGVYVGKIWKRHDGIFDRAFLARGGKPEWLLCWYGPSNKPNMCSVNHRKIILPETEDQK